MTFRRPICGPVGPEAGQRKHHLPVAKRDFALLHWRWVVNRDFAGAALFPHLARDGERLSARLIGFYCVAFA